MRVLVACEFSGIVRDAFTEVGCDATSCDLLPTERPGKHIQGDVLEVLSDGWDLMVAHPPCTYLSYAATRVWNEPGRVYKRLESLKFFADLWSADIPQICIENPKGCASPAIAKFSQEIQPWQFGDREIKTTWLWLKGLPSLRQPEGVSLFNEYALSHEKPEPHGYTTTGKPKYFMDKVKLGIPGKDWGHARAKFWTGIGRAMAEQWGKQ